MESGQTELKTILSSARVWPDYLLALWMQSSLSHKMVLSNVHKQISFTQCTSLFSTIRSINIIIHKLMVIFIDSMKTSLCIEQGLHYLCSTDLVLIPKQFGWFAIWRRWKVWFAIYTSSLPISTPDLGSLIGVTNFLNGAYN